MPHASATIIVDARLHWVVPVPESQVGSARAASCEQLAAFCAELDALQATFPGAGRAGGDSSLWVGAIALAVLESLREPPELPFIGEPFGGQDGTD